MGSYGTILYYPATSANQLPGRPSNVSPANAATGVGLTPTLQASAFSDPDAGDTHAASQWQISTTAGTYSSPVFDSSTDASHLTNINAPSLNYSTAYFWHVRYQDNHGDWSSWSTETSFTTTAPPSVNQPASQPSNVSPAGGATSVSLTPMLQASAFSDPDAGDTHAASQSQITTTAGNYSSPVFDSSTDASYLTNINAPSLNYSTTYYWHVRYQDNHGDWSSWSSETSFTTATATAPQAGFSAEPTEGLPGQTITFTDLSTGGKAPFSYEWDFNHDGTVDSTDQNPTHSYTVPGTYTVSLKVTDADGKTDTETKTNCITIIKATTQGDVTPQGSTIETDDGQITVEFPAGALATAAIVTIKQVEPSSAAAPKGFRVGNTFFTVDATDASGNAIVTFSQPVTITVRYSDEDLAAAGGDPSNLVLAYYDEAAAEWKMVDTTINTTDKTLSATTTHFSTWAVLAKSPSEGLAAWVWIVIGIAAAAGAGIVAYFLRRRLIQKAR